MIYYCHILFGLNILSHSDSSLYYVDLLHETTHQEIGFTPGSRILITAMPLFVHSDNGMPHGDMASNCEYLPSQLMA